MRTAAFLFLAEIRETDAELRFEAAQAAGPAVAPSDDGGIHQQFLPGCGRLQRASDHGGIFVFSRVGVGVEFRRDGFVAFVESCEEFVVWRQGGGGVGGCAIQRRSLT